MGWEDTGALEEVWLPTRYRGHEAWDFPICAFLD